MMAMVWQTDIVIHRPFIPSAKWVDVGLLHHQPRREFHSWWMGHQQRRFLTGHVVTCHNKLPIPPVKWSINSSEMSLKPRPCEIIVPKNLLFAIGALGFNQPAEIIKGVVVESRRRSLVKFLYKIAILLANKIVEPKSYRHFTRLSHYYLLIDYSASQLRNIAIYTLASSIIIPGVVVSLTYWLYPNYQSVFFLCRPSRWINHSNSPSANGKGVGERKGT